MDTAAESESLGLPEPKAPLGNTTKKSSPAAPTRTKRRAERFKLRETLRSITGLRRCGYCGVRIINLENPPRIVRRRDSTAEGSPAIPCPPTVVRRERASRSIVALILWHPGPCIRVADAASTVVY